MVKNISSINIFATFTLLCFLGAGSIIANQFQVALYLIFFLLPIYISEKFNLDDIFKIFISIGLWIIFNSFLYSGGQNNPILITTPSIIVNNLNILLIAWINCIIYFFCFSKLININIFSKIPSTKILIFTLFLCSIETIYLWENKPAFPLKGLLLVSIIFTIFYIILLKQCFSKKICLYINMLFSLIPIISIFFAFISIFFVLQTFNVPHDKRPGFIAGYYFLIFLQTISLSSIAFYFMKDTNFINKNKIIIKFSKISLLLLLSIGVLLQTKYDFFNI